MPRKQLMLVAILAVASLAASRPRTRDDIIRDADAANDDWGGDSRPLEKASAELMALIETDPKDAMAHCVLGRTEMQLACGGRDNCNEKALSAAMEHVKQALVLDPKLPDAHVQKGWIFKYQQDWYGVEEEAKRALELRPDFWRANHLLARSALDQRHAEKAISFANRMLVNTTEKRVLYRAHYVLAYAYTQTRELQLADASHRAAIADRPSFAWSRGNYAGFLLSGNRPDEAIAMAKSALALSNYPAARSTLKSAYSLKSAMLLKAGDVRGAEKYTRLADAVNVE